MQGGPTFVAVAIGFALMGLSVSPLLLSRQDGSVTEAGCSMFIGGIAIVLVITAAKVLS